MLDDEQVRAREAAGARGSRAGGSARVGGARVRSPCCRSSCVQAQLQTEQSKVDADGRVRQAEADLAAAEAQLAQQQAVYQLALFDKEAYTQLAKTGAVSERQGKQAASAADQQAAGGRRRRSGASKPRRARSRPRRPNLTTPDIRAAAERRRSPADRAAEGRGRRARRRRSSRRARSWPRREANRAGPDRPGAVRRHDRHARGRAGRGRRWPAPPIVTLVDLRQVYLRGFVPEGRIGAVKVGPAGAGLSRLRTRPSPSRPSVSRIDPQATFTPENTYFRDDRVKQVVGVKLQLKGAVGFAKPGMPADGEILVSGGNWPNSRDVVSSTRRRARRRRTGRRPPIAIRVATSRKRYGDARGGSRHLVRHSRGRDLRADRSRRRRQDLDVPDAGRRDGSDLGTGRGVRPARARDARRRPAT